MYTVLVIGACVALLIAAVWHLVSPSRRNGRFVQRQPYEWALVAGAALLLIVVTLVLAGCAGAATIKGNPNGDIRDARDNVKEARKDIADADDALTQTPPKVENALQSLANADGNLVVADGQLKTLQSDISTLAEKARKHDDAQDDLFGPVIHRWLARIAWTLGLIFVIAVVTGLYGAFNPGKFVGWVCSQVSHVLSAFVPLVGNAFIWIRETIYQKKLKQHEANRNETAPAQA